MADGLSVADLHEAITLATEKQGAWGANLHPSKPVLLRLDGTYHRLSLVTVGFVGGSFALILEGHPDDV